MLITDTLRAMGLPQGRYQLGGLDVEVTKREQPGCLPANLPAVHCLWLGQSKTPLTCWASPWLRL